MKNQIITIANEKHEIYNVLDNMILCVKLGKDGQRLSPYNKKNLVNFTNAQFESFKKLGVIK